MRRAIEVFSLCSIVVLSGCAGGSMSGSGGSLPAPQHGGSIVSLPGGKGFAELLIERTAPAAPGGGVIKTSAPKPARLVAYFYQPDGAAAMAPAPSDVKVRLGSADSGTDIKLTAQTTPAGLFASEPGQFPAELRGQIDLTCGGEPVQAPFTFR
jgi:hypothetical protein